MTNIAGHRKVPEQISCGIELIGGWKEIAALLAM